MEALLVHMDLVWISASKWAGSRWERGGGGGGGGGEFS